MRQYSHLQIGMDGFGAVVEYLQGAYPRQVLLVADENTYRACGQYLEAALEPAGCHYKTLVLADDPRVYPDETSIARVFKALDGQEWTLAAVGSGTITDIVRFVCYQARLPFISVPTALSVDAYGSYTAAISIDRVKYSIAAKEASGVYAHLPTLAAAPREMNAAGFSDMIAKFTALADWKLASLLTGEVYDKKVADEALQAATMCVQSAAGLRGSDYESVSTIMQSLFISGQCMVQTKSSRPAAGSEHSLAHFWEMTHAITNLPESLHGQKTGVASVIIAELYEKLRQLTAQEAAERMQRIAPVDLHVERAGIGKAYGSIADQILSIRASFLGNLGLEIEMIKSRLLERWDQVMQTARTVPTSAQIRAMLREAGSCVEPADIHVTDDEVRKAVEYGMYTRDRFTILELNRLLGLTG